jgi:integrase
LYARAALQELQGLTGDKEFVFVNPRTDAPWTGAKVIRTAWIRLLKAADVRYRNPYQTRHTFASMMLSSGEEDLWVAMQMGHTDTAMIRRVYGRYIQRQHDVHGDKAVALYFSDPVSDSALEQVGGSLNVQENVQFDPNNQPESS